jgi:hypothetical protein
MKFRDILIKGKSDAANPFIFHNVVEGDTVKVFLSKEMQNI